MELDFPDKIRHQRQTVHSTVSNLNFKVKMISCLNRQIKLLTTFALPPLSNPSLLNSIRIEAEFDSNTPLSNGTVDTSLADFVKNSSTFLWQALEQMPGELKKSSFSSLFSLSLCVAKLTEVEFPALSSLWVCSSESSLEFSSLFLSSTGGTTLGQIDSEWTTSPAALNTYLVPQQMLIVGKRGAESADDANAFLHAIMKFSCPAVQRKTDCGFIGFLGSLLPALIPGLGTIASMAASLTIGAVGGAVCN